MITAFSARTGEKVYVVPVNTGIDTLHGFPKAAQSLAHSRILLSGTFATYAAMVADLSPADGLLYYVTDAAKYFVKVGATTKGTWREAVAADGVVRRANNSVHPSSVGYKQMADVLWAVLHVE